MLESISLRKLLDLEEYSKTRSVLRIEGNQVDVLPVGGCYSHIDIVFMCVQTRILVTHGVSFLPHVDEIVVLVDGVVSEVGSYKRLRANKGAFSEFLNTYAQEQSNRTQSESGNYTSAFCEKKKKRFALTQTAV